MPITTTGTRLTRHLGRIAAVATLAGAGVVVGASPAFAFPSQCRTEYLNEDGQRIGAKSICLSGTGRHQIHVQCHGINGYTWHAGPYKNTGTNFTRVSTRECPLGTAATNNYQVLSSS